MHHWPACRARRVDGEFARARRLADIGTVWHARQPVNGRLCRVMHGERARHARHRSILPEEPAAAECHARRLLDVKRAILSPRHSPHLMVAVAIVCRLDEPERAVVERDSIHVCRPSACDRHRQACLRVDADEPDATEGRLGELRSRHHGHRLGNFPDRDALEHDVRDVDSLLGRLSVAALDMQSAPGMLDPHVGYPHVAYRAVAHANAHAVRRDTADDVRDAHVLAHLRLVLEPRRRAAYGDSVVARHDVAVSYPHVAAGIDVEAVGVEVAQPVPHRHSSNSHVLAPVEEAAPAAHVAEGHVPHLHVRALDEDDLLSGPTLVLVVARVDAAVAPADLAHELRLVVEEGSPVAVDDAPARDRHTLLLEGENQVLGAPSLVFAAPVLRIGVRRVVVCQVRTAEERCTRLEMELRTVSKVDGPDEIRARRHCHAAASGPRAGVKRRLHRGRVHRGSVALGTKRANVEVRLGRLAGKKAHGRQPK